MSRTLILAIVIAAIGAGGYFYFNQTEQTPGEQLQDAAQDTADAVDDTANAAGDAANDAVIDAQEAVNDAVDTAQDAASDALDAATDQANEAASSVSDAADQAGEQVAALANQGQELFNSWLQDGLLTGGEFDYDAMVASVQDSDLTQEIKTQAIQIFDEIKASPETLLQKIQDLRNLLTQQ